MSGSNIFTIGSVARHRGEYNTDTVYYTNNQVTMYGSVFQALSNNFSNMPPLVVGSDKTVSLANTDLWKCIIDNVALYNATLSTNNIDSRVSTIEGSISTIEKTSQDSNKTSQSAMQKADSAASAVNDMAQTVSDNSNKIKENTAAIEALQKNASPLQIACNVETVAFAPDKNGKMELPIPLYIYDNGTDVTEQATVSVMVYTPAQAAFSASWDGIAAMVTVYAPGEYVLKVTAASQGKTAQKQIGFYLTLPTTITESIGEAETQLAATTVVELPVKMSVAKSEQEASRLLFNIPSYLSVEKITCGGIVVPVTVDTQPKSNYIVMSTIEEVVPGTYDFIIQ